jgi:tetratricopeptide (TPR) repeat protein
MNLYLNLSIPFLVLLVFSVQAQELSVNAIIDSYNDMNYDQTIHLSNLAIQEYGSYKPEELISIYQYRALSYFHLGDIDASRTAFISMLSLNPDIELDPVNISPKIIDFYDQLKNEYQGEGTGKSIAETRYIQLEDPRPSAAWRSLVLPGWGQIYKGEQTKGYIIFSAFVLNSTALIISIVNENTKKDIYLSATHPDDITTTYDEYNKWHRMRQYLTYSQIIIWSYAVADAIWKPLPSTHLSFSPGMISVYYRF